MNRRLIQQGKGGFTVYLPKKWVDENRLQKGDLIGIQDEKNKLILKPEITRQERIRLSLDVDRFDLLTNRAIIARYIRGVDEIEVTFSSENERVKDFKKRVIQELIGFEIFEQTRTSFVVRDVTGNADKQFGDLLDQLLFMTSSMLMELSQVFERKEKSETVIETERAINRLSNCCLRILNKQGYLESSKTSQYYAIVTTIEEIGDILKEIAGFLQDARNIKKEQIVATRKIVEQFERFKRVLKQFDQEQLVEFAKEYEVIKKLLKGSTVLEEKLLFLNHRIITLNNQLMILAI